MNCRCGYALLGLVVAGGCVEFESGPQWLLKEPRLLAIRAEPPTLAVDGQTRLQALVVSASGDRIDPVIEWRACNPWQFVLNPDLDCGPTAALPLDGTLTAADVLARFPPPTSQPVVPPATAPPATPGQPCAPAAPSLPLPVVAETRVDDRRFVAVKDVPVLVPAPAMPRTNPALLGMRLDGVLNPAGFVPGRQYELAISPELASLDIVCRDGVQVNEALRVHVYVTAGSLDFSFFPFLDIDYDAAGTEAADVTRWVAPNLDRAVFWFVAIDGDGGVGWRRAELMSSP